MKYMITSLLTFFSLVALADKVNVEETQNGTVTYAIEGSTVTLTITPDEDYYTSLENIKVRKTIDGGVVAQSRRNAPGISGFLTVTPVVVDDRGKGTYTFTLVDGYDAYVQVSFEACRDLYLSLSLSRWTYGDTPKTPTLYGNDANGEVTYSYAKEGSNDFQTSVPKDAGSYVVRASVAAKGFCRSGQTEAHFVIDKALLYIRAKTYTKKQGAPMPEFTLTYDGFKYGDTSDVLTVQPEVTCEATVDSEPGKYFVTVSGAEAENYYISHEDGFLIVVDPSSLRGDANDDGSISVTDIAVVVNCILQLPNNGGYSEFGADANGDGDVTVTDIGVIVDKILGTSGNSGNAGAKEMEPQ